MNSPYIPLTEEDIREMLSVIGVDSFEELISIIPEEIRFKKDFSLPSPLSEEEAKKLIKGIADKNRIFSSSFAGAGSYDHIIPSVIHHILMRSEFYTAYTPYQAEVSQGTLQSIYEYQSFMCRLMNMEVANASMYDAGSALPEAVNMGMHVKKKKRVIYSSLIHPDYIRILKTYLRNKVDVFSEIDEDNGTLNIEKLERILEKDDILLIQHPNFLGFLEDMDSIMELKKEKDLFLIMIVDPVSLSLLKPPGDYDADVAIAEGQPFGIGLNFGGPYLGIFTTKKEYVRLMPGRLVAMTEDLEGKRGFVLTLQTREQHIKRERATSNICTNQALCALSATIFLSLLGKAGFTEMGTQCLFKSHYLYNLLKEVEWVELSNKEFFREFPLVVKDRDIDMVYNKFIEKDILPGVKLGRFKKEWRNYLLVTVTERRTKEEIDNYINILKSM